MGVGVPLWACCLAPLVTSLTHVVIIENHENFMYSKYGEGGGAISCAAWREVNKKLVAHFRPNALKSSVAAYVWQSSVAVPLLHLR